MKIAVIGWYGRENAGDERIFVSLKGFFSKHEVNAFNIQQAKDNIKQINSHDYVLLGGGGLLLRGFNLNYTLFSQITKPFGCIGIGVEAMNSDMKRTVDLLLEKSNFILVRDEESRELLSNHYKTIVAPDLSFLQNYGLSDPTNEKTVGLNLRKWSPFNLEFGSLAWQGVNRLNRTIPLSKIWPLPKWDDQAFVTALRSVNYEILPMPFCFENGYSDAQLLSKFFEKVPKSFDINWYKKIRYLVAMRFHALVFSVQCGIPFVAVSYQPKCERFCKNVGMDEYCLDAYSAYRKVGRKLLELEENYQAIRNNLLKQRDRLSSQITYVMSEISNLMEIQIS